MFDDETGFDNPIGYVLVAFLIMSVAVALFAGYKASLVSSSVLCGTYETTTYYNGSTDVCQEQANASVTNDPIYDSGTRTLLGIPVLLVIVASVIGIASFFLKP